MATTLSQQETLPAAEDWPMPLATLSTAARALEPGPIWQRIEAHAGALRVLPRPVVWTVEGPGPWTPPIAPVEGLSAEEWTGTGWRAVTLAPEPLGGFELPGTGPYRIAGTAGLSAPNEVAEEAFRRLAEYLASGSADLPQAGVSRLRTHRPHPVEIGEQVEVEMERNPRWIAQAMQLSGAADLLRPYRRA